MMNFALEWAAKIANNEEITQKLGLQNPAFAFYIGFSTAYEALRREAETN